MNQPHYTGNRVIVTGGAGFIGSHLCRDLLARGNQVLCIDNLVGSGGSTRNIDDLLGNDSFRFLNADMLEWSDTCDQAELGGVDCIFNQAASKNSVCMITPETDLAVNAAGPLRLLELIRRSGIRKLVHASTGSVYGPRLQKQDESHPRSPASLYGNSKLCGETYCRLYGELYGVDSTTFRYFHVIGPYQDDSEFGGVVPIFIRHALAGEPLVIYGTGEQIRSFTSVRDVVTANVKAAATSLAGGQVMNCASGIQVTIEELARYVVEVTGSKSVITHEEWRPGDVKFFDVDNSRIREVLAMDFQTDWRAVVRETLAWYMSRHS